MGGFQYTIVKLVLVLVGTNIRKQDKKNNTFLYAKYLFLFGFVVKKVCVHACI